jgi:signal transduction histidine kinase
LPASTLEKSSTSLSRPSKALAAAWALAVILLARVHLGLAQQLQHAQHRIHRRADLVAHIGHEVRLGAAGLVGRLLGLQQRSVRRARLGASVLLPTQLRMTPLASLRQRVVVEDAPLAVVAAQPAVAAELVAGGARAARRRSTGRSSGWITADQSPDAISWRPACR